MQSLPGVPRLFASKFRGIRERFRGTPVRYWFDVELAEIFGITERPSRHNADTLYDRIADRLVYARFREGLGGRLRRVIAGGAALAEQPVGHETRQCGEHRRSRVSTRSRAAAKACFARAS